MYKLPNSIEKETYSFTYNNITFLQIYPPNINYQLKHNHANHNSKHKYI